MSLGNKIFIFFLAMCFLILVFSGAIIIENVHKDMISTEVEDLKSYGSSLKFTINHLLVVSNISGDFDRINFISDYLMTTTRSSLDIELHDEEDLLMATHKKSWMIEREDLDYARRHGKNYFLRKIDNRYMIFFTDFMVIDDNSYYISLIKDITYIIDSRRNQYYFFIGLSFVMLMVMFAASYVFSKLVTGDIKKIISVTTDIEEGNYGARINLNKDDDIGLIANHIDKMADKIDSNIYQLKLESESKQRFIDNFTHELKTPLTSIIGYSDTLRKLKYDKKTFDKGLYHIYEEGHRLSQLSQKLNEIILLKDHDLPTEKENLQYLLEDVIAISKMRQYGKSIDFKLYCKPVNLQVDKELFKMLFLNLVDNAIKASGQTGQISLGASKFQDTLVVYVEDNGRGIPSDELDHITEAFYMVDKSRKRQENSFGLGLSICKQAASLMHAKLNVKSELDKGTRVEVSFNFTSS
ncbi:HAMP domain-containing histidine kinase [Acidaminobacter sp. JC074]|uniref:sensor histidine kinase n=1 Tax=Acidaminobacter sp. JC074 TaxID=2530199 RepID=UPI001F0ED959|nr:HAMP domain-containing sensor histidine kinase [Acidaminobacter sp. JC074]MCH4885929.1 HAMP domain-containing histidine kinase [Acidaminobacter sp. JC074]